MNEKYNFYINSAYEDKEEEVSHSRIYGDVSENKKYYIIEIDSGFDPNVWIHLKYDNLREIIKILQRVIKDKALEE